MCLADVNEHLCPEQQEPEVTHMRRGSFTIKKGEHEQHPHNEEKEKGHPGVKEEEADITKLSSTGVSLKSEDQGQSEKSSVAKPPSRSSSQRYKSEGRAGQFIEM